jgi:integrase
METATKETPAGTPPGPQVIRNVIRLAPRPGRPSPYGVQWRTPGRKREFFTTEKLRDARFTELTKKASRGLLGSELSRADRQAWEGFCAATQGAAWQDVVAGWRSHLAASGKVACTTTVSQAAKIFLAEAEARLQAGEISRGYHSHVKTKIRAFSSSFAGARLSEVTPDEIEQWIDDLAEANGTFNVYRKIVRAMFGHFKKETKNPCDEFDARSEVTGEVEVLTVPQTARLFNYALGHEKDALGRLALEAFAGLRFSSALRLEKTDIKFEGRGILLPAHKIKTRRRHYIDGLPENLWSWLEVATPACWAMQSSEWMHMKTRLFTDAGVPHPRNCLRHSFCTYHVAAYKDPGKTATILCHRNQQKLWSNYNGVARASDGNSYFTITPQTAAALAE